MKKCFKYLFIFGFILLIAGCTNNDKEVVRKCTLTSDQSASGYKLNSTYEIHAKGNTVNSVVTEEVVTSSNTEILTYFENQLNTTYNTANETYGGYTIDIKKDTDKLTSKVTIDYTKLDMAKFVKDNSGMKAYVNSNNKLTLDGATKIYESLGATCEK